MGTLFKVTENQAFNVLTRLFTFGLNSALIWAVVNFLFPPAMTITFPAAMGVMLLYNGLVLSALKSIRKGE